MGILAVIETLKALKTKTKVILHLVEKTLNLTSRRFNYNELNK